jgi:hypothetical protein
VIITYFYSVELQNYEDELPSVPVSQMLVVVPWGAAETWHMQCAVYEYNTKALRLNLHNLRTCIAERIVSYVTTGIISFHVHM